MDNGALLSPLRVIIGIRWTNTQRVWSRVSDTLHVTLVLVVTLLGLLLLDTDSQDRGRKLWVLVQDLDREGSWCTGDSRTWALGAGPDADTNFYKPGSHGPCGSPPNNLKRKVKPRGSRSTSQKPSAGPYVHLTLLLLLESPAWRALGVLFWFPQAEEGWLWLWRILGWDRRLVSMWYLPDEWRNQRSAE